MNQANRIMERRPDSALVLLKNIDDSQLAEAERARYALLMSMALDKNYIDTTTFDVLQPAIDYYPDNGTSDEILKTYYYQGRVFQNQGDLDNALYSFIRDLLRQKNVMTHCSLPELLSLRQLYLETFWIF